MPAEPHETGPPGATWRRRVWPVVKWSLCVAVIAFVGRRAWELWHRDELGRVEIHVGWLILAGSAYAVAWLPSVWFWRTLMQRLGGDVRLADAARAYYCGHLGKYIPGKATVLVIRSAMLKGRGSPISVSVLAAVCETLLMMGAGLVVALALCPLLLRPETTAAWPAWLQAIIAIPLLPVVAVTTACIVSLPVIARLVTYSAVRMTPRGMLQGERGVRIDARLVARALLAFAVGWLLHGLSLGLTLCAVSGGSVPLADLPTWTGAAALSTVLGFVILVAPGGVGVREGALIEILRHHPAIGPQQAIVAAVLMRAVSLVTELLVAAALYWLLRPSESAVEPAVVGEHAP